MDINIQLAWLAGIIEGEGCFSLVTAGRYNFFQIAITITNTDLLLLNECINILSSIGINARLTYRSKKIINRKPRYDVVLNGFENMKKFIDIILPFMKSSKKAQAELMGNFLERRIKLMHIHSGKSHRRIKYDDVDMSYLEAMKQLKKSESVETERSPSQKDEVTVRSACIRKDADFGRNIQSVLN
jgi:intein/homing endonuclease